MTEPQQFWSVTSLQKLGVAKGGGLDNFTKETTAGLCFDKHKIFSAFVDEGDRNGALDWALAGYWDVLGSKAARGTAVHNAAEALALGQQVDVEPAMQPYVDQYRQFLEDMQPEFLMAEAPVYNVTHRYAGTLDSIAVIQGQRLVCDIKTTEHGPNAKTRKGRPKSRPPFPEVALQLTMYRRAELVGILAERVETSRGRYYMFDPAKHTEPMPETDGGVCIVISPEDYLVVPVDTSERVWRYCRHMIEMARWNAEASRTVFGPLLAPTKRKAA